MRGNNRPPSFWYINPHFTSQDDIRTDNSESSNPGTSSLILSTVLPASQQWIPSEEIIAPSVVTVALGIIANVGGAFVAVSGVFSVIFGRKIWEVVAGEHPHYTNLSSKLQLIAGMDNHPNRWQTRLSVWTIWLPPGL